MWLHTQTGHAWRLPCELEREKASRGVDGRSYPWGDHADPAFHCMRDSQTIAEGPAPPDDFPVDTSPYGVRGLAGGVQEWCADVFSPVGPAVGGDVVTVPRPPTEASTRPSGHEPPRTVRGGAWNLSADWGRAASRQGFDPGRRTSNIGFRLCRGWRDH